MTDMRNWGQTLRAVAAKRRRLFRNIMFILAAIVLAGGGLLTYQLFTNETPSEKPVKIVKSIKTVKKADLLATGWDYMPGVTPTPAGLQVDAHNFAIVEQNGAGGQANPPINLYGTHLQISGNVAITARLASVGQAAASLQLYGATPIVMDEFRIEPASVRFTLNGTALTVQRWNSGSTRPVSTQSFPCTPKATNELRIERQNGSLVVACNGATIATIPEQNVFQAGNVWFGLSSENGPWLLSGLKADALPGGKVTVLNGAALTVQGRDANGLQMLAAKKRPDFLVGAAAALAPAIGDDAYAQVLLGGNFGSITTENVLKWQFVHPLPAVYDFREADALIDLAARHGLTVHGHTLVFAEANPRWVRDIPAAQLEATMLDHIKTVVGHYKGKINSWDVVNEPFDDDEWDQLRPHLWYKAMGESYIAKAFNAAHAADPDVQLFINDYGLEEDGDRWNAMLALVKRLKAQGVPIHGVGFQAHVYERGDKINPAVLRKHIQQLAAIGLKARVSEMDVYIEDGTGVQADQYSKVLQACMAEPACVSFTTWGVSDRYDWFKDDDGSIQQGEDYLWNKDMQPTPAVTAIRQLLR